MNIAETDAEFIAGNYQVFLRYKDGTTRQFKIEAFTQKGYDLLLNQFCPRIENIVYARSRLEKHGR